MPSSDLIRADFYGRPVSLHIIEGGEWVTADVAAPLLELADRRKVSNLFNRHRAEFVEGSDFALVTLRPRSGDEARTQGRKVLAFSLDGLEYLAMLTRSRAGAKLRRWCVDTRKALRGGGRIVTPVQVDLLRAEVEKLNARLVEAHADHAKQVREMFSRLCLSNERMASAFGAGLGERGRQKRAEQALRHELDIGQRFLTPDGRHPSLGGERGGDLIGPAVGGEN
jgi:prophage antirepressor-like protein